MQKRLLLNFCYIYFVINYINLPLFKSLRLLNFLRQVSQYPSGNWPYSKFFSNNNSDFLINGGALSFFFKSVNTKLLPVSPYQANFSLNVGLRKVYKGFDTRLIRIKKSAINFNMLYNNLIDITLVPTNGIYSVTSTSVNNIKYKNKKWKYIYSCGSFFYIKWYRTLSYFLINNKHQFYYSANSVTSFRLNKSEDVIDIKPLLPELFRHDGIYVDTVSNRPIGDFVHEVFYNSIYTYFLFLRLTIKYAFSLEFFSYFWRLTLCNAEVLDDVLYDGFEPMTDLNNTECNSISSVAEQTGFNCFRSGVIHSFFFYANSSGCVSTSSELKYYAANRLNNFFIVNFFKLNKFQLFDLYFFFTNIPDQHKFLISVACKTSRLPGLNFLFFHNKSFGNDFKVLQKSEFFLPTFFYQADTLAWGYAASPVQNILPSCYLSTFTWRNFNSFYTVIFFF